MSTVFTIPSSPLSEVFEVIMTSDCLGNFLTFWFWLVRSLASRTRAESVRCTIQQHQPQRQLAVISLCGLIIIASSNLPDITNDVIV